jgi:hypothetical protein
VASNGPKPGGIVPFATIKATSDGRQVSAEIRRLFRAALHRPLQVRFGGEGSGARTRHFSGVATNRRLSRKW